MDSVTSTLPTARWPTSPISPLAWVKSKRPGPTLNEAWRRHDTSSVRRVSPRRSSSWLSSTIPTPPRSGSPRDVAPLFAPILGWPRCFPPEGLSWSGDWSRRERASIPPASPTSRVTEPLSTWSRRSRWHLAEPQRDLDSFRGFHGCLTVRFGATLPTWTPAWRHQGSYRDADPGREEFCSLARFLCRRSWCADLLRGRGCWRPADPAARQSVRHGDLRSAALGARGPVPGVPARATR